MKINTSELLFRAKQIAQTHQHNSAKHKRNQWLQSAFNCIAFGNINIFSRLMEAKNEDMDLNELDIDLEYSNKFRETILHSLCRNQRILMMEHFLVNHLGDPNEYSTEGGMTPFHLAVVKAIMSESTEAVELLLNHGANILKTTKKGDNIQQLVRMIDPGMEKECSKIIVNRYREALSIQNQIILLQVLESPARDEPPFSFLTEEQILELLCLL